MFHRRIIIFSLLLIMGISACSLIPTANNSTATPVALSATPAPPTPTEPPLAARLNGKGIPLSVYQTSLQQFQAAQNTVGTTYTDVEARQIVLDELINQTLLEQGATAAGFTVDDALIQSRVSVLISQLGGDAPWQTWLQTNGYTLESFEQELKQAIAADWQQQQIMNSVPTKTEQIHARQLLLYTQEKADKYYAQLQAGADFKTLAFQVDPLTGGDLGWFPRGYLTQKSVEDAAFALQPGQYSAVIKTDFGYQIIFVIERDPAYPLTPDALLTLQKTAIKDWITSQKEKSTIEILVP